MYTEQLCAGRKSKLISFIIKTSNLEEGWGKQNQPVGKTSDLKES